MWTPWKKGNKKQLNKEQVEDVAKAVQAILESGYGSHRQVYKVNFFRGIFFAFGSFLGATVVVALFAWLLSFFDNMFIIGDIIDAVQDSLNRS